MQIQMAKVIEAEVQKELERQARMSNSAPESASAIQTDASTDSSRSAKGGPSHDQLRIHYEPVPNGYHLEGNVLKNDFGADLSSGTSEISETK